MSWTYLYRPRFLADMKGLDHQVAVRILAKIDGMRDDPLRSMKRLKGSDLFSLRIGHHRVHARAYVPQRLMVFVRAGHRRNVYDG